MEVKKMEIPKTVKVAGYNYQVEHCDSPFPVDSQVCDGAHTFSEQKIKVAKTGTAVYQRTVFLHELVHAIIGSYCGDVDEQLNERFADQFSKGLYQVITDNPDIFKPEKIEKEHDICPICRYPIPSCQCMYDHGIDRSKRMEVVFSHLHLLTPEQQKHVVRLQSEMNISYEDSERDHVYWELMGKNKCGIKI
jgi:hypothetical protein